MDTQKECMAVQSGNLPDLTCSKVIAGAKQLRKALQNGQVQYVFLARNADAAITLPFEKACREAHIDYAWVPSMKELGRACGIEVGAAVAAVINH